MSTVYTTLDYEYRHKNKGTSLALVSTKCRVYKWDQKSYKICTDCRECMCKGNSHIHMYRTCMLLPHRQPMKLKSMIVNIKTKVLIKFGTSEMMCVEMRAKKPWNVYRMSWMYIHGKFSYSHVQNTLQPHRQSTKLKNMIANIKTKVLIKFGTSEMMCVELRAKMVRNVYRLPWMCVRTCGNFLVHTHTEVTNTMSTAYTIQDYEYRHKNKGTGLVLVSRKCGVYKWDQESYKMCTVPINMKYTQNAHPHTHRSHQCHFHCLHHFRL